MTFSAAMIEEFKTEAAANHKSLTDYIAGYVMDLLAHVKKNKMADAAVDDIEDEEYPDDGFCWTPELEARLEKAREEQRRGECLHFDTVEEMDAWLEAL